MAEGEPEEEEQPASAGGQWRENEGAPEGVGGQREQRRTTQAYERRAEGELEEEEQPEGAGPSEGRGRIEEEERDFGVEGEMSKILGRFWVEGGVVS